MLQKYMKKRKYGNYSTFFYKKGSGFLFLSPFFAVLIGYRAAYLASER